MTLRQVPGSEGPKPFDKIVLLVALATAGVVAYSTGSPAAVIALLLLVAIVIVFLSGGSGPGSPTGGSRPDPTPDDDDGGVVVQQAGPYPATDQGLADFARDYKTLLKMTALRMVGPHDAEDVVQDVFVELFKRWDEYAGLARGDLEARARTITMRRSIDRLRRWSRRVTIGLLSHPEPQAPDATPGVIRDEDVRNAILKLPPRQRAVIVLAYFHGLSNREIAEELHISEETVKTHRSRAYNALRKQFGGDR